MKSFNFKSEYEIVEINGKEFKVYYDMSTLTALKRLDNKDLTIEDIEIVFNAIFGREQCLELQAMRLTVEQFEEVGLYVLEEIIGPKISQIGAVDGKSL